MYTRELKYINGKLETLFSSFYIMQLYVGRILITFGLKRIFRKKFNEIYNISSNIIVNVIKYSLNHTFIIMIKHQF